MLLLLAWLGLFGWHWHMARRVRRQVTVAQAEKELAGRLNRYVRVGLAWGVAVWVLALVVWWRADATLEAARGQVAECRAALADGMALQACMAEPQRVLMDGVGTAAASEVVVWVVGIL